MKIIEVICIILWIIAGILVLKDNKGDSVPKSSYIFSWITLVYILIIRLLEI